MSSAPRERNGELGRATQTKWRIFGMPYGQPPKLLRTGIQAASCGPGGWRLVRYLCSKSLSIMGE